MCQFQEVLAQATALLTKEGMSGLMTRTSMGLQADIPFYYSKYTLSDKECIKGESLGKLFQILLDYTM